MALNLKYRRLKAFVLAVETGSFKAAADELAVTQPSFSTLIKELENDADVLLFDRSTRRSVLTDAGRAFYEEIRVSLSHLEDAYQNLKAMGTGTSGKLSLAALPSLAAGVVTQALGQFRHERPGVRISLQERKNGPIIEAVRRGEVELGVGSLWTQESDLEFRPLIRDHLLFVAPNDHPIAHMKPDWACAEHFDLILMNAGPTEHALRRNGVLRPAAFEVEHLATALAMVRNGMGVSILPSSVLPTLNMDGLICLPIRGPMAMREVGIIVRNGLPLSAPALAFTQLLESSIDGSAVSQGKIPVQPTQR